MKEPIDSLSASFDPSEYDKPKDSPWWYITTKGLIKERKPCLEGDYVHFHSIEGCYRVHRATVRHIFIMKNGRSRKMSWDDFRCLHGNGSSQYYKNLKEIKKILENTKREINQSLDLVNKILKKG